MNKVRRGQLQEIQSELETLKSKLEELQQEEQDYYDNMPDAFQFGEKGEKAQTAIDGIESGVSSLDDVINGITEVIEA